MPEAALIREPLDIKLLILYVSSRLLEPASADDLLAMCRIDVDHGFDYFEFTPCLTSLVKTEHMRQLPDRLYEITDKGRQSIRYCETDLPVTVRRRSERNILTFNRRVIRKQQVQSSVSKRQDGLYTLSLSLSDDIGSLMNLNMMMVRSEMADQVEAYFQKYPAALYTAIVNAILETAGQVQKPEETAPSAGTP